MLTCQANREKERIPTGLYILSHQSAVVKESLLIPSVE